jgi:FkbM family methyltransferase
MENAPIMKMLPKILAKPNPVVFELGANHGQDTEKIIKYCKGDYKYYAFEPDPRTVAVMKEKGLHNKVEIIECAVSALDDKVKLYQFYDKVNPNDFWGTGPTSIMRPCTHEKRLPHLSHKSDLYVPTITLDNFCQERNIKKIDFMWVDIQGSEYNMIMGAKKTLKNTDWLFMEAVKDARYHGQKVRKELIAALPDWKVIKEWSYDILMRRV